MGDYDSETGVPVCKDYLERGLPAYLQSSIKNMTASWEIMDSGKEDWHWDLYWCELNAGYIEASALAVFSKKGVSYG